MSMGVGCVILGTAPWAGARDSSSLRTAESHDFHMLDGDSPPCFYEPETVTTRLQEIYSHVAAENIARHVATPRLAKSGGVQ